MRYVESRAKQKSIDDAYRIIVCESLRTISENSARTSGGSYITVKFSDILNPPKMDNRPVGEIVDDVLCRAGIEVINSECI